MFLLGLGLGGDLHRQMPNVVRDVIAVGFQNMLYGTKNPITGSIYV